MPVQFAVSDLSRRCNGHLPTANGPTPGLSSLRTGPICTDTRTLQRGQWFVALEGKSFNGHDYIQAAVDRGALGCVVTKRWIASQSKAQLDALAIPLVAVPDTLTALQDLARSVRDDLSIPVVGITGSAGKTSTKDLTALALSPLGLVHKTDGNYNNLVGLPLTLLACPEPLSSLQAVVLEMGMNQPGEIRRLAEIAQPTVRLITNVGPAHLEGCGGTVEGVARCKQELFETAAFSDTLLVNADDPLVSAMVPVTARRKNVLRFGSAPTCDLQLVSTQLDPTTGGTRITVNDNVDKSGTHAVRLQAAGLMWGTNVAAALSVARACGVPLDKAAAAIERDFRPASMRMQVHRVSPSLTLIDDSYNANPLSMCSSIQTAFELALTQAQANTSGPPRVRLVLCLGDMKELGPTSSQLHTEVLQDALQLCGQQFDNEGRVRLTLLLVGSEFADAVRRLDGSGSGTREVSVFASSVQLAERIQDLGLTTSEPTVMLVKGSRGMRMDRVVEQVRVT